MVFCPDGITPNSGLTGLNNTNIYIYIYITYLGYRCRLNMYLNYILSNIMFIL